MSCNTDEILLAFVPGQTWTIAILLHILAAKDLEEGKDLSFHDLYERFPFMETEWNDGQLGTDKFLKLTAPDS